LVLALDVGTAKVAALVGRVGDGPPEILGAGISPSRGISQGMISDLEAAAQSVADASRAAQKAAGIRCQRAWVGINGPAIWGINTDAQITVSGPTKEIDSTHLHRVLSAASSVSIPAGREVLEVLPRSFTVDELEGVKRPVGLSASKLKAHVHLVTAPTNMLENLEKAVEGGGLTVEEVVFAPLAAAEAILSEQQKNAGAVAIDLGAGSTGYALFRDGAACATGCVQAGGLQLTSDISFGLMLPPEEAETLKIGAGASEPEMVAGEPPVGARSADGRLRQIARRSLAEIIHVRLREILVSLRLEIRKACGIAFLPGGAVLTGGGSLLRGVDTLAARLLSCPVSLAQIKFTGASPQAKDPRFHGAVGILAWAARREHERRAAAPPPGLLEPIVSGWEKLRHALGFR
jgi:cell division protein FtsA